MHNYPSRLSYILHNLINFNFNFCDADQAQQESSQSICTAFLTRISPIYILDLDYLIICTHR